MNLHAEVSETLKIRKHFHKFSVAAWMLKKRNNMTSRIIVNPIGHFNTLRVGTQRH